MSKASETRKANLLRTQEHEAMMAASADEIRRLNQAIADGATVTFDTFCGLYQATMITHDFTLHGYPVGSHPARPYEIGSRSWAGCNNGEWAQMLAQAGVVRNPRYVHLSR